MRVLGMIPARGGSTRFPRKNLARLAGKPLVAHACAAALDSGVIDAVHINTDDPEIAETAQRAGAACIGLRPKELATPTAAMLPAAEWLLQRLEARGEAFDVLVILQPTSPLRVSQDVRQALDIYWRFAPCIVKSVAPLGPANWAAHLGRDGRIEPLPGAETLVKLNGAIYVFGRDDIPTPAKHRRIMPYVMPRECSVDIDEPADLRFAAALLATQRSPRGVLHAAHEPRSVPAPR